MVLKKIVKLQWGFKNIFKTIFTYYDFMVVWKILKPLPSTLVLPTSIDNYMIKRIGW